MLDIIAALAFGVMCAVDMAVLVSLAPVSATSKVGACAIVAAWIGSMVAIAALGGFRPGRLGPIPTPVLAFAVLTSGALGGWGAWPAFRRALLSLPLAALVGINGFRLGGVLFLLLFADGRLSAPFAPSAGWGDIVTGVMALLIAARAGLGRMVSRRILTIWNAFGALDLVVAVMLAFLSAPGTGYRVFMEGPGTAVLTTLPWILAATFLVPLYLVTHLAIAVRLRSPLTA